MIRHEWQLRRSIRTLLVIFIAGLVVSGITAFPILSELKIAHQFIGYFQQSNLTRWIDFVYTGVKETNDRYSFIAYGTDWLAFAHLVIAVAFIGPLRDPIKNIWVVQFGIISCILVFPLAFIAGAVRGIPLGWRLIDCSFGLFGGIVLLLCYKKILLLARLLRDRH